MAQKNRTYQISDEYDLNLRFYEGYDEAFLMDKASTLWMIVNRQDEFKQWTTQQGSTGEGVTAKYFEALRAGIYFTEFHQFEALFALLLSIYQSLPHWLYLTTYRHEDIRGKVEAFISGDIKTVTDGETESMEDFLNHAIYHGYVADQGGEEEQWRKNIDNIAWLLRRRASKYQKASDSRSGEYNAYKHGLRVMTGEHFMRIGLGDNPAQWATLGASPDLISFLETKDEGGHHAVHETTRHFNPKESIRHLSFMMSFLGVMKNTSGSTTG